jgi:hypothetical protein
MKPRNRRRVETVGNAVLIAGVILVGTALMLAYLGALR